MHKIKIIDENAARTLPLSDFTFEGDKHAQRYKLIFPGETWIVRSDMMPPDAPPDELRAMRAPAGPVAVSRYFEDPEHGLFRDFWAIYHKGTIGQRFNCEARRIETAATAAPWEPVCRVHFIERTAAGDTESILDVLAIERPERRERVEHQHNDEPNRHVEWHTIRDLRLLTATECISIMRLFPPENHPDAIPTEIIYWPGDRNGDPFNAQLTFAPDGKPRLAGGPGGKLVEVKYHGELVLIERTPLTVEQRRAIGATPETGNAAAPKDKPVRREPATATAELESEIIRILSRDFSNLKARPTATDFYHEYVISTRTMAGLHRAKGWALRTMKKRKADIEAHLTRTLGMTVDLDTLRGAPRKAGRLTYKDPTIIERTASDATQPDEE